MKLIPYLNFNGECEEAFRFYHQCLGGKIEAMITHEGTPAAGSVPAEWRGKIMHARLVVGDQVLMGSDYQGAPAPLGFSVSVQVSDPKEAERIFHGLAEGGKIRMPIQETFWANRFGMVTDRFGIPWMVNCEKSS